MVKRDIINSIMILLVLSLFGWVLGELFLTRGGGGGDAKFLGRVYSLSVIFGLCAILNIASIWTDLWIITRIVLHGFLFVVMAAIVYSIL